MVRGEEEEADVADGFLEGLGLDSRAGSRSLLSEAEAEGVCRKVLDGEVSLQFRV